MLTDAWPLFGLELRTERLVLRPPTDDDFPGLLDAIDAGIHPPEVMPFTHPWTDVEPVARRRSALQFWWRARASWSEEAWNLLFVVLLEGRPIGVQELMAHDFTSLHEVLTGSWLTASTHGIGVGKEMRAAVLDLAFHGLGASRARSDAFADNPASLGVSRSLGYRENGSRFQISRGRPAELVDLVVERETWLSRGAPRTVVVGLEACLPMFGLPASGLPASGGGDHGRRRARTEREDRR